jgi:hypothetical protein
MLMRFRGGGVGHKSTCESTAIFLEDHDPLDEIARDDSEEDSKSDIDQTWSDDDLVQVSESTSTAQNQAAGEDEDDIESEMDEYRYGGIDEEEEATDEEGAKPEPMDGLEEANDEVGPEDGEDDAVDEYEGYAEL